jgi:hypothetical protein
MPNNTSNRLWVAGAPEDVSRLVRECTTVEEGETTPVLDFNKIIPMPAELDIVSSSYGQMAYEIMGSDSGWRQYAQSAWIRVLGADTGQVSGSALPMLMPPPLQTKDDLIKHLATHLGAQWEEAVALAVTYATNFARFGCMTWDPWRRRHWGTKWSAYGPQWSSRPYENGDSEFDLQFSTAWSAPVPIMKALSRKFPALRLELHSLCEGRSFATLLRYAPEKGWSEQEEVWEEMAREQFGMLFDNDGDEVVGAGGAQVAASAEASDGSVQPV